MHFKLHIMTLSHGWKGYKTFANAIQCSRLFLRGPNLYKLCDTLVGLQILIVKTLDLILCLAISLA